MHVVTREHPYCGTLCRIGVLKGVFLRHYSELDTDEYPGIDGTPAMSVSAEGFGGGSFGLISIWGV